MVDEKTKAMEIPEGCTGMVIPAGKLAVILDGNDNEASVLDGCVQLFENHLYQTSEYKDGAYVVTQNPGRARIASYLNARYGQ